MWRHGELVALSPTEFKLLRYLLLNAEQVLSKSQIAEHIWQYDFGGDANIVETHMSYLRRKLGEPPADPDRARRRLRAADGAVRRPDGFATVSAPGGA